MGVLDILGWSFVAAVAAWGATLSWAHMALSHVRAGMRQEIEYWQAEAARARDAASQLRLEIETWTRGLQQGREDVMAIMPMLMAAQEQIAQSRAAGIRNAEV